MKLKRKKIGDRNYNLVEVGTGEVIANAVQTGEHGRDNYPWEWSLNTDWIFGRLDVRTGHSVESLKDAVDIVETGANNYGLFKPVGKVEPFAVREGQIFRVMTGGRYFLYRATQEPYGSGIGSTAVYIPANDSKGALVEVMLLPEDTVTVYVEA
jgi:hypothetical protein